MTLNNFDEIQTWLEEISNKIEEGMSGKTFDTPSPFVMHYLLDIFRQGMEIGLSKIPPQFYDLAQPKNIIEYEHIVRRNQKEFDRLKTLYDRDQEAYRKEILVDKELRDENGNFILF